MWTGRNLDAKTDPPTRSSLGGDSMILENPHSGVTVDLPLSAFSDLRTVELLPVTGWTFNYNINSDLINTTLTGSGTATTSNSKAVLQTGAAASSSAQIQTIRALRYNPGLGALVRFTAVFTAGVSNSTQIVGVGDNTDGFFFGYNGASFGVLIRQNGTNNWIPQSSWNYDTMNGSGPSHITLNPTLGNVYGISYQWLGFGAITFWVENPLTGLPSLVHIIQYANTSTNPSIFNPTLPLTAQVANTTNTSNLTLQTSSAMGMIEGNGDTDAIVTRNSFSNGKIGITTTETSIFSLLNQPTFQGKTNRVHIQLDYISAQNSGGNPVTCILVKNGTLGGTPNYVNINANTSVMAADTSGTTVTGGTNVLTFGLNQTDSAQLLISDLDIQLEPGSTFTLATFTLTGTSNVNMAVSWKELW
jgi:hypothetical protein